MSPKNYSESYISVLKNTYNNICLDDIYDRLITLRTLKVHSEITLKKLKDKLSDLKRKKGSSLKSEFEMLSIENDTNVVNKDIKILIEINKESCVDLEKINELIKHYVTQLRTILEISSDKQCL